MKKLLFILLAWIPLLAVSTSCQDDLEEHELIVEKFGLGYDTTQVVFGTAVYDSVFNTMAIQIDTASLSYFNRAFIEPETGYLLRPLPDASFDIEEGQELIFKFRYLKIVDTGVNGKVITCLKGAISDISPVDRSFHCGAIEDDYIISKAVDFENEVVYGKVIKVYVNFIRGKDGYGVDMDEFKARKIISQLIQYYGQASIAFVLGGYQYFDYFDDTNKATIDLGNLSFLKQIRGITKHNDGIDIYCLAYHGGNTKGVVDMNDKTAVYLTSNHDDFTIRHEMGHSLGLYHTHKGTCKLTNGDSGTPEFVDGSNGDIAGDYMRDTPADPCVWNGGKYVGTGKDAHGQSYTPDPLNIMSYSEVGTRFSQLQIKKMHATLRNEIPNVMLNIPITGPIHFNGKGTFTRQSFDQRNIHWSIKRLSPGSTEGQSVENVSTATGTSVTLQSGISELIELSLIDDMTGAEIGYHKATAGIPSTVTGSLLWSKTANGAWEGATTDISQGNTLYISGTTRLYLGYEDKAGATLSNLSYRTVTAANRVLNGANITIDKADCAAGFLKFRISDSNGTSPDYFTIPVSVIGGYYAVDLSNSTKTTFISKAGSAPAGKQNIRPTPPNIDIIDVYNDADVLVKHIEAASTNSVTIETAGWPKGEYHASIRSLGGYSQTIVFVL